MAKLTEEEIWAKKEEFNFTKLLEPYTDGGTEDHYIQRTMGTIIDYFINKKQYPIDIVGAAVLLTFFKLKDGGVFHGDGTYGSKGRELVTYIRQICDRLLQTNLEGKFYQKIAEARAKELSEFIKNEVARATTPWWKRWYRRNFDKTIVDVLVGIGRA